MVAGCGALLSVHLRSENEKLFEAVEEVLSVAARSHVNLKISHLKAAGRANWPELAEVLKILQGISGISFDVYPYDFEWKVLYTYLPKWAYLGGRDAMLANLKNPEARAKILAHMQGGRDGYADLVVASTTMPMNVNGKTLGEVAERLGTSSEESLLTILENGGSEVMVFDRSLDIGQVRQLVAHPLSMVATDGAGFPLKWQRGLVHPRSFGAVPTLLEMSLREQLVPIEQAVHKISGKPAAVLGLKNRGQVTPGFFADLVVFSPGIRARSTATNPHLLPTGIHTVMVNGQVTGTGSFGKVLRRN